MLFGLVLSSALVGALTSASATASAASAWTPPINTGASSSVAFDWLLAIMVFVTSHAFLMLFAGFLGPMLFGKIKVRWKALLVVVLIANLILGSDLKVILLHQFGVAAAATITAAHQTGNLYNDHDVVAYDVLIRSPDHGTLASSFEDDDFNVYPWHNATAYPGRGDVFTVRYLPHFTSDFAILADDGSPWATALRCVSVQQDVVQAEGRAGFSNSAADQVAFAATKRRAATMGCA